MATRRTTRTGTMNVQPRIAGDMALLRGVAKAVLEAAERDPKAIDGEFLERHTVGFEELVQEMVTSDCAALGVELPVERYSRASWS